MFQSVSTVEKIAAIKWSSGGIEIEVQAQSAGGKTRMEDQNDVGRPDNKLNERDAQKITKCKYQNNYDKCDW